MIQCKIGNVLFTLYIVQRQTSKYILIGLSNGMLNIDLIPNLICQDTSLCMTSPVLEESCTVKYPGQGVMRNNVSGITTPEIVCSSLG